MSPTLLTMSHKLEKAGFTLLEILVAVTIIAVIVSMVYGSYIATVRTAHGYGAAIAVCQDTRAALAQITRQIRCAYVPRSLYAGQDTRKPSSTLSKLSYPAKSVSETKKVLSEIPNYFSGNIKNLNGEVLHLVTTAGFFTESQSPYGLFEVTYSFDRNKKVLFFSQQRFARTPNSLTRSKNHQQILSGVEHFKLTFFDGQKWLNKWDFKDRRALPYAVKIDIICQDKNYRRCRYRTVAHIPCQKDRGKKAASNILGAIDELWD